MGERRNKKDPAVDPKLRRKMLERWENEGGKIGSVGPEAISTDKEPLETARKILSKDQSTSRE